MTRRGLVVSAVLLVGLGGTACEVNNVLPGDAGAGGDGNRLDVPVGDAPAGGGAMIRVTPTVGLMTSEAGQTAQFAAVLTRAPAADVVIAVTSSNPAEGTASPTSLRFTSLNWASPQLVTVTGVDDPDADGDVAYKVVLAPADSADTAFLGVDPDDVSVLNVDDETPRLLLEAVGTNPAPKTSEAGGEARLQVSLNTRPSAAVTVPIASSDPAEGTVTPATLTFTQDNWNAPQELVVTGVDDTAADGDRAYDITAGPSASSDPAFNQLAAVSVQVTNVDNEGAGVTVSAPQPASTTEAGGQATFTIVLNKQPAANVSIPLTSDTPTEGTVSPAAVTFTPDNWNAPQTVTVTGVDDSVADGSRLYTVQTGPATSTDDAYAGINASDVALTNTDNDSAGLTITPGLSSSTTEAGGTASFTVVLNTKPKSDVTIALASTDTTEGTPAPATLTFTTVNWNASQTVTVTGVNDDVADGNQAYEITGTLASGDTDYNARPFASVALSNTDNDSPGVTVTPTSGLVAAEGGGTSTFTVVLNSRPNAAVSIGLSSSDTSEGTVAPATLTFTTANWNAPQTVTVTGVDDVVADGAQPFTIVTAAAMSTDPGYDGIDPANVAVSTTDNDSAGVTVMPSSGLVITEAGGSATFSVVLNSQPSAAVTIALSSSAPGVASVAPASLSFSTTDWNVAQMVTVTGVDDSIAGGNRGFSIITAPAVSTDTAYNGINPPDVSGSNTDNDTPGFTITGPTTLTTSEAGGTASFTIQLRTRPLANVTLPLSVSATPEAQISPASVTLGPTTWNIPVTVTVTGVDDNVDDGNQPYTVVLGAATSSDAGYNGLDPDDLPASNVDDDAAAVLLSAMSGLVTTEVGGSTIFTVRLSSRPNADVVIGLSSSDTTEGTVAPSTLTFTSANWDQHQTVTITGVNDSLDDGDIAYTVVTSAATSMDTTGYSGLAVADVSVTNTDNDTHGVTVSAISGNTTEMGAGTATFTVVLNSRPNADVTIGLTSNNTSEGTVAPASVTFLAASTTDWMTARTITVTGVDDAYDDGNVAYSIVTAAITSSDTTGYNGYNPADVAVTNTDNDTHGVTVSSISGHTTEAGGTATFTVVLTSRPSADVTIAFTSDNTAEGTVAPASVTFLAASTTDWMTAKTITVTGVDDVLVDTDVAYTIVTAAITSSDTTGYNGYDPANVSVTNDNNDVASSILVFHGGMYSGIHTDRATVDGRCQGQAGAGFPTETAGKTVRALISMSGTDQMLDMPTAYGVPTTSSIKDISGANTIAANWGQFMTGTLDMSLSAAGVVPAGVFFWTGTLNDGTYDTVNNCTGWTSNGGGVTGRVGFSNSVGDFWKSAGIGTCSINRYILCIAY